MIISLIIALFSFLLFLSYWNYYYSSIKGLSGLSTAAWNWFVQRNLAREYLIQLFNLGINGFLISFYFFSLTFSQASVELSKKKTWIPLSLIILQLVLYDPFVLVGIDRLSEQANSFRTFLNWQGTFYFKVFDLLLIWLSFKRLNQFREHFPEKFTPRKMTSRTIWALIPVCLILFILFNWFPRSINKSTLLEGIYLFDYTQILLNPGLVTVLSSLLLASLYFIVLYLLRANTIESYYRQRQVQMHYTAELGVKAFSHTMKNDLLAIRAELDYLEEKLLGITNQGVMRSLEIVNDHCDHAFKQLNDLSHKVKVLSLNLQNSTLDLPLKKAMSQLSFQHIEIDMGRNQRGPEVYIDLNYMEDVFYNILQNSIEALRNTRSPRIKITIEEKNKWGIISFSDNGKGIAKEHLGQIFTPFFSTGNATRNWGVGLSFCNRVIQAHEGEILVDSTPGRGTTLTIMLHIL